MKSNSTSYGRQYNIFSQTMLVIVQKAMPSVSILLLVQDLLHGSHSEAVPAVQVWAESFCCPLVIKVSEAQRLPCLLTVAAGGVTDSIFTAYSLV